jgi:GDP-mannose 6-dehydrogenase
MKISIFGLGYVGCVGIGCLAENGNEVIGVDVIENKVALINSGKPTIIEKDIDNLIADNFVKGRISATTDFKKAVVNTEVSIICVGTPSTPEGHLNLNYIYRTAENIAKGISEKSEFHIVIIRSTVLPGTNKKIGEIIEEFSNKKRGEGFTIISNPEFLREGTAVQDYYNPAITVIGGDHDESTKKIAEMYKSINAPIEITDIETAEIIKYVNNSFHALKIVFANEVGSICKKLNIDSHKVMELFCKDDQLNISPYYFKPGFAYGGSCLPKDLKGLKTLAHDNYLNTPVLNNIEGSNIFHKSAAYSLIEKKGKRKIGILGLSFKAGTDDLRYSPAVELTEKLIGKGFEVNIYDANVNLTKISGTNKDYIDLHIPHLSDLITDDLESVIKKSEVLVITQNNVLFKNLNIKYADKQFLDFVRVKDNVDSENYEGICW